MPQSKFTPEQAVELAAAFPQYKVDHLFIGKSGAILPGYLGKHYQMEYSTDLTHWTVFGDSFAGTGGKTNRLISAQPDRGD